jgi:hypothetical protein
MSLVWIRLAHHQDSYNTLSSGLSLHYSKVVMNHLVHVIDGMMTKWFSGTLTDLHELSHHRSTAQLRSIFCIKACGTKLDSFKPHHNTFVNKFTE